MIFQNIIHLIFFSLEIMTITLFCKSFYILSIQFHNFWANFKMKTLLLIHAVFTRVYGMPGIRRVKTMAEQFM